MIYHLIGGYGEEVDHVVIGRGREFAAPLCKYFCSKELTLSTSVEVAVSVISWVSTVANSVGYEIEEAPDVVILKDDDPHYKFIKKEKAKELQSKLSNVDIIKLRESLPKGIIDEKKDLVKPSKAFVSRYK